MRIGPTGSSALAGNTPAPHGSHVSYRQEYRRHWQDCSIDIFTAAQCVSNRHHHVTSSTVISLLSSLTLWRLLLPYGYSRRQRGNWLFCMFVFQWQCTNMTPRLWPVDTQRLGCLIILCVWSPYKDPTHRTRTTTYTACTVPVRSTLHLGQLHNTLTLVVYSFSTIAYQRWSHGWLPLSHFDWAKRPKCRVIDLNWAEISLLRLLIYLGIERERESERT